MNSLPATNEWASYLDRYASHLDLVEESLAQGKISTLVFNSTPPSSHIPEALREKAAQLATRNDNLIAAIEQRMNAFATVLRYSRMKDPSRIVLIDVLA